MNQCGHCQSPLSPKASACPKCGHPQSRKASPILLVARWLFGIMFCLGLLVVSLAGPSFDAARVGPGLAIVGLLFGLTFVRSIF